MTERTPSLHERIVAEVSARIVSGEWPPGHRIPFEHEMTQAYGCSRMTVNKALSQLARAGLIERRKRSGSFVARPRSQAAILDIHDIREEVEATGAGYRYDLLSRVQRPASKTEIAGLGLERTAQVVELVCRHMSGDVPFCLERRIVNLAAVPSAAQESFETSAPGPWLIGHVPWSSAEHRIAAVNADAELAGHLAIRPGAACLVVERRTWFADRPVTMVVLAYPGTGHSIAARFTPDSG